MNGNTLNEPFSYSEGIESLRNGLMLENEFKQMIESALNLKVTSFSSSASFLEKESGCIEDCSIKLIAHIPTENKKLQGTRYYYSEGKRIIHFTSINVLFSIINEGAIRMYNLHNSNDDFEYSFASSKLKEIYSLGQNDNGIERRISDVKEYSFILSTTSLSELRNKAFWDKYGHGGKGVAIEFEIINDLNTWEYSYFSKVHYNKLDEFEALKEGWSKIQLQNKHIHYRVELDQLLSFHKSERWNSEKEIRILTLFSNVFHSNPFRERIYSDFKFDKADKPIKYFKLPLCDKNGEFIDKELNSCPESFRQIIPKLRISNIYFSSDCPISNNDFTNFQVNLQKYVSDKMNCWIGSLSNNKKVEYVKQTSCSQLSRIFNLFLIIIQYLKQFFNQTTTRLNSALAFIPVFNKL